MANITLSIEGMTCAACAKAVERAVNKLSGIQEAAVNLATEKLSVRFDDKALTVDDIKVAVEKAGYKAIEKKERADGAENTDMRTLKKRLVWSSVFAVPLFIIAMVPMLLESLDVILPTKLDPMHTQRSLR